MIRDEIDKKRLFLPQKDTDKIRHIIHDIIHKISDKDIKKAKEDYLRLLKVYNLLAYEEKIKMRPIIIELNKDISTLAQ